MPLLANYTTGTVTVAANGTAVTGAGTQWIAGGLREGDLFIALGLSATILSVNSATSLTLEKPWPGAALSGSVYEIRYTPDASRVLAASREAITLFGDNAAAIANAQLRKNNLAASRAPVATDDGSQGYAIGSRWMWGQSEWVATSAAPGAAVWKAADSGGAATPVPLYSSAAAFYAATVPIGTDLLFVTSGGEAVGYRRQAGANGPADLHHPNGTDWAKATTTSSDILAANADVTGAIDRIPYETGSSGSITLAPATVGTFTIAYGERYLSWVRIGPKVFFEGRISGTPTLGTGAGVLRIAPLPFPAATFSSGGATFTRISGVDVQYYTGGVGASPGAVGLIADPGDTELLLSVSDAKGVGATVFLPPNRLATGRQIIMDFQGSYEMVI